jgi:hypothetical protein
VPEQRGRVLRILQKTQHVLQGHHRQRFQQLKASICV